MPRHNHRTLRSRKSGDDDEPRGFGATFPRAESGTDGEWLVRKIPGAQATKVYRCPGCDHEIQPGVPHLVAWPALDYGSVQDRRHWHTGCWAARDRRGPTSKHW
ncbi:MAG TPA: hypothetical protein VJ914_26360 [Pseudonocardiaceae bacterium]|nr:hypothetical protein [Pseudonocardiaceae bacterium]